MPFRVVGAMEASPHPLHVALAVLLGAAALSGFFEAVRFQWPESYFAAGDTSSYALSLSPCATSPSASCPSISSASSSRCRLRARATPRRLVHS